MARMEDQPRLPFFKHSHSPVLELAFFVIFSLALMVLDLRFHYLEWLRQGVTVVSYPLQQIAYLPVKYITESIHYVSSLRHLQSENSGLRQQEFDLATRALRQVQLEIENQRLRALLDMQPRQALEGRAAEIVRSSRDPFSHKILIDKGSKKWIAPGNLVIDDLGVIGQVTRVFPWQSEVTLINDKNQAVHVQVVRNGLRAILFGTGEGQLELRFLSANADVIVGDQLVTSGLDGVYLPGLPVARVARVDRDAVYAFARIQCIPLAAVEKYSAVFVVAARAAPPFAMPSLDDAESKTSSATASAAVAAQSISGRHR